MIAARRAARALDALARGWPIAIGDGGDALTLAAVETAPYPDTMAPPPHLLISAARAATLKITNQRAAAQGPDAPVLIMAPSVTDAASAMAIADPARDLANPFKGPFQALPLSQSAAATEAMAMARTAGLLPAFYCGVPLPDDAARVALGDIAAFADPASLMIAARARLPVAASADADIIAFRSQADHREHVALVIGTPDGTPPLVRLHSECLTGDVLASLKCDCGPQLHQALALIAESGWGILLYLRQEGRSIGLINKLRAYQLQDQGFDTVDANNRLGFATDARDFGVAARMLDLLGVKTIRLLTNNPDKVAVLQQHGIAVAERVAHSLPSNPHNARYLDTKRDRTGHKL